jgi:two-component system CheB/CheR fusion protein
MDEDSVASSNPSRHEEHDFFVVGIGASAGGIAAFREFFSAVPPDIGMAFVVILHISAGHESNLPALIQNQTTLQVSQVTGTVAVEPNHVYVIPPSKYLALSDGKIQLAEPERPRGAHTSIDLLFRTLAHAYGKDAVAILMSGTGNDGVLGIRRIKEQAGFVIVQDPSEAEYTDMPRAGIETGLVDMILPVGRMPEKLAALHDGVRRLQVPRTPEETPPTELDSNALRELLNLVRLRTGNDFTFYKRPTLLRRIARRMQVHGLHDLQQYLSYIREHPTEIGALLQDLLISVTNFFRDHDTFDFVENEIVPLLFQGKSRNDQVRVWSVGCATGEEAYSLAMILAEYASKLTDPPKIQVFGTDIDTKAIAEARECQYPPTIALDVSSERLRRFFTQEGNGYVIKKELRALVLFAPHNVLRDPPFSRLDLISCRNLLIYLNHEMQERVLGIFRFALRESGYILLGSSETADIVPSLFTPVDKKRKVFISRKQPGLNYQPTDLPLPGKWQVPIPEGLITRGGGQSNIGELHYQVVEELAPPSVLINEEYEILHVSAHAGRYLQVGPGEPSRNLLKLVHPDLRLDLRAALLEARARDAHEQGESRHIMTRLDGQPTVVNLRVRAVVRGPEAARGFFLVMFDEDQQVTPLGGEPPRGSVDLELLHSLEQDLQRTKDQLRITIEQYETSTEELRASNEELQAINEELRSASEELETSKEELQSVNEELTTVNQEYREKIEEVGRANSDLQNLMASTDIGTIFLDRTLCIKRYTPRAQSLFNITLNDIGRPLEHFTHKLDYGTLTADADEVLRSLQMVEREVRSGQDHCWYLARLIPYRTLEDQIDGVVLTFVDITRQKDSEEQLRRQAAMLREQAEVVNLAHLMVLDHTDQVILWNTGSERLYGYTAAEAIGRNAHELLKTEFPAPPVEIDAQLRKIGQWEGELVHTTRDGKKIVVASHRVLFRRDSAESPVILEVDIDITDRHVAEEALRQAHRNKDRFLAMLAHELRNPLSAMVHCADVLEHADDLDSAAVARAKSVIRHQLEQIVRMVDDLLDIEGLTQGKIELVQQPVQLAEILQNAIETCHSMFEAKNQTLEVSIGDGDLYLNADSVRLSQVFANILNNASKYTPEAGRIEISASREDGIAVVNVTDNGAGIAPEMLPHIFDVHFQGEQVAQHELKGLGLGLSLVKSMVEMHGGSVETASDGQDKGSRFTVRLPIMPAPPQPLVVPDAKPATARRTTASKRLLWSTITVTRSRCCPCCLKAKAL